MKIQFEKIRFSKRALEKDPLSWFKDNNKKIGDVITTKIHEVLKSGVKVSIDKDNVEPVEMSMAQFSQKTTQQIRPIFALVPLMR